MRASERRDQNHAFFFSHLDRLSTYLITRYLDNCAAILPKNYEWHLFFPTITRPCWTLKFAGLIKYIMLITTKQKNNLKLKIL